MVDKLMCELCGKEKELYEVFWVLMVDGKAKFLCQVCGKDKEGRTLRLIESK